MRYFVLTILLIFSSLSTCLGQSEPVKVPFVAYWAIGDTFEFTISKIKSSWKEGALNKTDTTQYGARFVVLDSTDHAYRIKWETQEKPAKSLMLPIDMVKAVVDKELESIIYKTNELGTFIELEDWKEISESMAMILEEVKDDIREKKQEISDEFLDEFMQPLIQAYSSKQGLEQIVFKELQFLHYPFGAEFSLADTIVYERYLPNMLGGDNLKGIGKIYVEQFDQENAYCRFKDEMDLDSESVVKMLKQTFAKMGLDNEEKMQEALSQARYEIRDRHIFEYIYDPGIPIRIEIRRESDFEIGGEQGYSEEILLIEWFGE